MHNVPFIMSPNTAALSHRKPASAESFRAQRRCTRDRNLNRKRQTMTHGTKWLTPAAACSNPLRVRIVPTPVDDNMVLWTVQPYNPSQNAARGTNSVRKFVEERMECYRGWSKSHRPPKRKNTELKIILHYVSTSTILRSTRVTMQLTSL